MKYNDLVALFVSSAFLGPRTALTVSRRKINDGSKMVSAAGSAFLVLIMTGIRKGTKPQIPNILPQRHISSITKSMHNSSYVGDEQKLTTGHLYRRSG